VRPAYGDGDYLASHIVELQRRSQTFRELLDAVGALPAVRVLVAPAATTARPRQFGRTSFALSNQEFIASMEIVVSYDDPNIVAAALAHEFAHVFEAACLADAPSLALLERRLRSTAPEQARRAGAGGAFETPLAIALGREVVTERLSRSAAPFLHAPLVTRYPVGRCARAEQQVAGLTP
jgi:hypothetical protein